MPISARIALEHSLEAPLLDVNTDERAVVPVIQHGKELKGKLILSVRRCRSAASLHGLPVDTARVLFRVQATKGAVEPFSELELSAGTRLVRKARRHR